MSTLLGISNELVALEAAIDAADGEITETIDAWLESLGAERDQKIDNYAALICECEARAAARDAAAERLIQLKRLDEAKANALRDRLKWFFERHNIRKMETERHRIAVQAHGGKVPLNIDGDVPPEFTETKIIKEPNRAAIRAALEAGQMLPFATLGERGSRLAINEVR